jgi:hypothetical protein
MESKDLLYDPHSQAACITLSPAAIVQRFVSRNVRYFRRAFEPARDDRDVKALVVTVQRRCRHPRNEQLKPEEFPVFPASLCSVVQLDTEGAIAGMRQTHPRSILPGPWTFAQALSLIDTVAE